MHCKIFVLCLYVCLGISMVWYKKDVTPVHSQWSYVFIALNHANTLALQPESLVSHSNLVYLGHIRLSTASFRRAAIFNEKSELS